MLDATNSGGNNAGRQSKGPVPPRNLTGGEVSSGMDNDPDADEEVIDQQADGHYPKAVETQTEPARIVPDDLADSIAYAIDGSGPGPIKNTPA